MSVFIEDSIVLALTYGLIAARGTRFGLQPWAAMLLGASLTILMGIVPPSVAFSSINLDVILFLVSLFTIASALEVSGFLGYIAYRLVASSKSPAELVSKVFLSSAALSMFLTNDGVAGSMAPVIASMQKQARLNAKPLLYSLAFGVTIGSVALPIGNPQNLLIALDSGMAKPFIEFIVFLLPPTLINLAITTPILVRMFRAGNQSIKMDALDPPSFDKGLAYAALAALGALMPLYILMDVVPMPAYVTPVTVSLGAASILYAYAEKRREVVMNLDWPTILFFIGLFIVSEGALRSGVLYAIASYLPRPTNLLGIFAAGILVSQVISNVPMVAIYIPLMQRLGIGPGNLIDWIALAASSTIAGNLTLIGAASNVIASESFERRSGEGFGFIEFFKYGVIVTIVNALVYYLWLLLMRAI
ncbi:MAG: SLC13 family permease [Thermocladium sp.]